MSDSRASRIVALTHDFVVSRGVATSHARLAEVIGLPEASPIATDRSPCSHADLVLALEDLLEGRSREQVFTPPQVARWLARQVHGSVLDPAAGTGRLLAARLSEAVCDGADPVVVVENRVRGVEIDPRAAVLARASLVALAVDLGARRVPRPDVTVGDSFTLDLGTASSVIMNPPFVNADGLSQQAHATGRARWPGFYRKQLDLSVLFLALAVESLAPGGTLSAIVPRYWLEATGAGPFRRWLLEECAIERLFDLGNAQVWPAVNTLTALVVLRKRPWPAGSTVFARLDSRPQVDQLWETGAAPIGSYDVHLEMGTGPWVMRHPDIERRIGPITASPTTVGDLFDVGQGLKAGRNDVFVMPRQRARELGLPEEVLRPTVKTRDIKPFRIVPRGNVLLRVLSDTDIERWPALRDYLCQHRADLATRYQVRKGVAPWYALSLPQNLRLMHLAPKILTPLYARANSFAVDGVGYHVSTDVYVIAPKPDTKVPVGAVVALLNSAPIDEFVRARAKLKRDGYREFGGRLLRSIPLPFDRDGAARVSGDVWREGPKQLELESAASVWDALSTASQLLEGGDDASVAAYVDRVASVLYGI